MSTTAILLKYEISKVRRVSQPALNARVCEVAVQSVICLAQSAAEVSLGLRNFASSLLPPLFHTMSKSNQPSEVELCSPEQLATPTGSL